MSPVSSVSIGGILPVAAEWAITRCSTDYVAPEQRFMVCPNQDVVYGAGFTALEQRADSVTSKCRISATVSTCMHCMTSGRTSLRGVGERYGTKPGFYMIDGPNWEGNGAEGNQRSITFFHGSGILRPSYFQGSKCRGHCGCLPLLNQIVFY